MTRDIDAICAGLLCLDIIPGFPSDYKVSLQETLVPGRIVLIQDAAISTGGPVSNTGFALSKLGMKVSLTARVGDDEFGQLTRRIISEWADVSHIAITHARGHSSYTIVLAPPGFDRVFLHAPGTNNEFCADDIDYDLCSRARIFHFGYPPNMRQIYQDGGEQLLQILGKVKDRGAITSLDMCLPDPQSPAGKLDWVAILQRVLPYVDLFHPSMEEALFMAQPEKWLSLAKTAQASDVLDLLTGADYTEMSDLLLSWGCGIVTLKSGHRGFYARTNGQERLSFIDTALGSACAKWSHRELWAPAYHVDSISTATGSGDSSIAGFSAAMLRGESLETCVAAANALGYQNLHAPDALSGIGNWQTTVDIIEDVSLPRNEIRCQDGWYYDPVGKLAYGPRDQSRHDS